MAAANVIVLDRGENTTCTINLHGATITSWRVNDQEQLFVSKLAVFDRKRAIRGGIPLVFPHFGPWTFGPKHGFARIMRWNIDKAPERLSNRDMDVVFSITDTDFTRSMWNFQFHLIYHIILRERELHCNVIIHNTSTDLAFSFNFLFHTYFLQSDARHCQIEGLEGCTYTDKTLDSAVCQENRDNVTINAWTDRIYRYTPNEHIITNLVTNNKIRMQKFNFPDTVVWNPWIDKAKKLSDFGDEEYLNMICLEVGCVSCPDILLPGTAFEARQILEVMRQD